MIQMKLGADWLATSLQAGLLDGECGIQLHEASVNLVQIATPVKGTDLL